MNNRKAREPKTRQQKKARPALRTQHRQSRTPAKLRALAPGWTQGELSRKAGIATPHLSRILSGKRGLSLRCARAIAQALDLDLAVVVEALAPEKDQDDERHGRPINQAVSTGTPGINAPAIPEGPN
jgi:hypothetical protein